MNSNRRQFLKSSGLAATGLATTALNGFAPPPGADQLDGESKNRKQRFNMCGYTAPKLDKVRIGVIGLGNRGTGAIPRLIHIDGVELKALCDIKEVQAKKAAESLKGSTHHPVLYSGNENEWQKLCERDDIDLVYITTPWKWHTPMAVYAMKNGKHAASEVPAAVTLEQCWELVETSEKTKKHCMMLEN